MKAPNRYMLWTRLTGHDWTFGYLGGLYQSHTHAHKEATSSAISTLSFRPGWWYTYPSEKHESQLGWLCPVDGNNCSKPPTSDDVLSCMFLLKHTLFMSGSFPKVSCRFPSHVPLIQPIPLWCIAGETIPGFFRWYAELRAVPSCRSHG